jgi:undecaprenyl-diphosphatase
VVVALVAGLLRAWRAAALAVLGMGLTGAVVEGLKHLVGRTLDGQLAMPSGHTAGTTALATAVALLVLGRIRPRRPVAAGAGALLVVTALAAVVAVTMTTLRLHYATDTVAGWGAGLAVTLAVAFTVDAAAPRLAVLRAAPAPDLRGRDARGPGNAPSSLHSRGMPAPARSGAPRLTVVVCAYTEE